jgi:hypothetical protein
VGEPKLTPTTNDQIKAGQPMGNGGFHLTAAHEPLRGEQFVIPQPTMELPTTPSLPPKAKRGRKPKEQTVNATNVPSPAQVAEPKPLKIALVGTAPSSRMLAPYSDPTWTIWGCSPGNMNVIPRVDAWFEVHGTSLYEPENKSYAEGYINWMKNVKCPLYMQDQQVCPNAISIPKDELIKQFGPFFFTSSFAWMMGMAILAGAQEVALYGIDMASRDEYIIQRPGAYYFFIRGAERGVKMWAPYESDIMQPPGLYGYSDVTPFGRKMRARRDELKERLIPLENQHQQLSNNITYMKGAIEDNDYMLSIHLGVQDNSIGKQYLDNLVDQAKGNSPTLTLTAPSQG